MPSQFINPYYPFSPSPEMHVDNVSESINDGENLPPYLHTGMRFITYPPSPPFPRGLPFRPPLSQREMCAIFLSFSRDYENKGERHSPISELKGIKDATHQFDHRTKTDDNQPQGNPAMTKQRNILTTAQAMTTIPKTTS